MHGHIKFAGAAGAIAAMIQGGLAKGYPNGSDSGSGESLRFLTYNVRYDSLPNDISVADTIASLPGGIPEEPSYYAGADVEAPWSTRRIQVANDVAFNKVDFFGGQEILIRQLEDLQELLGDEYAHIGIGRNGGNESEFSPIFYKPSVATLEEWDTFWLSETPFDISFYPGTSNRRICTTAKFTTASGLSFTFMNTHLDHEIEDQRRYGMSLILHRAKYEVIKSGGGPIVLTGDFNSPATGEDSGGYSIITGVEEPLPLNETFLEKYSWTPEEEAAANIGDNFVMKDLLGATPPQYRSGNWATFTGWAAPGDSSSFSRIDYVMAGSNGGW